MSNPTKDMQILKDLTQMLQHLWKVRATQVHRTHTLVLTLKLHKNFTSVVTSKL